MNHCVVRELPFGIRAMQYVIMALRRIYPYICLSVAALEKQVHKEKAIASDTVNQKAERLLNEYGNSVLRLAYSYLHNMTDAEDVLQDTLLQYLKTAPILKNESHEKAWLLRVAANLSKNRIKYNSFRKTDELDETLATEQREDLSFVWEAVKELPLRYRETFHLFYHEGYSTAEIALILKVKESTVRSNLRRGRMNLKEILREAYGIDETI